MKKFITDSFMLESPRAEALYHTYAKDMPIIDYHCHIPPADIAGDRRFETITGIWLGGDHYKWRAMRTNGVDERLITGDADPWEKFLAWAKTVPATIGNPLYHWTHLELARYFGITGLLLNEGTAREIYERCNSVIRETGFSAQRLVRDFKVEVVCTTDDPADTLEHHSGFNAATAGFSLLPAWRPDKLLRADDPGIFNAWIDALEERTGSRIKTVDALREALEARQDFFHDAGCRLSDHGLETFYAEEATAAETDKIFGNLRMGVRPGESGVRIFRSAMLTLLGRLNHRKGWTQQFHVGVLRNVNTRMFGALGPDSGFDSIGDFPHAVTLAKFLDRLASGGALSRTILYPVNPGDNEMIATMIGNFQDGSVPGKMQFGSAWWFMDQKEGMERQMRTLAAMGLLPRFIGMTTDSRSLLSYPRHEYFRRVLCNLLGGDMGKGLIPDDLELVGEIVSDICYRNAKEYFGFPERA